MDLLYVCLFSISGVESESETTDQIQKELDHTASLFIERLNLRIKKIPGRFEF